MMPSGNFEKVVQSSGRGGSIRAAHCPKTLYDRAGDLKSYS